MFETPASVRDQSLQVATGKGKGYRSAKISANAIEASQTGGGSPVIFHLLLESIHSVESRMGEILMRVMSIRSIEINAGEEP